MGCPFASQHIRKTVWRQKLNSIRKCCCLHRRAGVATGYWLGCVLRSVRQDGGLAVAKKLLAKPTSKGFEKLRK